MNTGFYKKKIDDIILVDLDMDSRYRLYSAVNVKSLNHFKNSEEYKEFKEIYGDLLQINLPFEINKYQPVATINLRIFFKEDEELNQLLKPILYNILNLLKIPNYMFADLLLKLTEIEISEKYYQQSNLTIVNDLNNDSSEIYFNCRKMRISETIEKEYFAINRSELSNTKSERF